MRDVRSPSGPTPDAWRYGDGSAPAFRKVPPIPFCLEETKIIHWPEPTSSVPGDKHKMNINCDDDVRPFACSRRRPVVRPNLGRTTRPTMLSNRMNRSAVIFFACTRQLGVVFWRNHPFRQLEVPGEKWRRRRESYQGNFRSVS